MWKYEKEILINDELEYKAIMLDKEVYRHSNYDLSDIRIVDQNDEFVPYYIEGQYEEISQQKSLESYKAEKILTFSKKDDLFTDFKLVKESIEKDFIVNQLDLNIDLSYNFAKEIGVYGSYDDEKWELIKNDNIFNILDESKSKTRIYFDEKFKYSYYRIAILQNIEDIQVDSIVAIKNEDASIDINDYIVEEKLKYKINQESNNSIVTIFNPNKLQIFKIQVFTEDLFDRDYILQSQSDYLYLAGTINSNKGGNIINIYQDYNRIDAQELNLTIDNKDDRPIKIDEILVSYYIDKLVFKASKGNDYRMLIGNQNAIAPSYDITSYKSKITSEKKELATFGNTLEKVSEEAILNQDNMKLTLNMVVIVTSLFLIFIIFNSLIKKK